MSVVAIGCLATSSSAFADSGCKATDPTGTPLNVRAAPQGKIVSKLANGRVLDIVEYDTDKKGQAWVFVADHRSGRELGWVFREFVSCYNQK